LSEAWRTNPAGGGKPPSLYNWRRWGVQMVSAIGGPDRVGIRVGICGCMFRKALCPLGISECMVAAGPTSTRRRLSVFADV